MVDRSTSPSTLLRPPAGAGPHLHGAGLGGDPCGGLVTDGERSPAPMTNPPAPSDTRVGVTCDAPVVHYHHDAGMTSAKHAASASPAGSSVAALRPLRVPATPEPIELVFDDTRLGGRRTIAGIEPPQLRRGDLDELEFDLREPAR